MVGGTPFRTSKGRKQQWQGHCLHNVMCGGLLVMYLAYYCRLMHALNKMVVGCVKCMSSQWHCKNRQTGTLHLMCFQSVNRIFNFALVMRVPWWSCVHLAQAHPPKSYIHLETYKLQRQYVQCSYNSVQLNLCLREPLPVIYWKKTPDIFAPSFTLALKTTRAEMSAKVVSLELLLPSFWSQLMIAMNYLQK